MDDLKLVSDALRLAREHSLESEVVLFALKALQKDNSLSIQDALEEGLSEWDV